MIDTFLSRLPDPSAQDGFLLIEVLISSMLVALIAVATFNGFNVTQRATADERAHAQATVLAQQDEERLRGMTATQLGQLGNVEQTVADNGECIKQLSTTWRYCEKTLLCPEPKKLAECPAYTGTAFTVTSSAQFVTASKEKFACETKESADYIQTTSSVTWPALHERPAVSQSSLAAVPSAASLMVSVQNRNNEAESGVNVAVYDPSTSLTPTAEETTPASGCVIFGELTAGTVKIVASKPPWVDHSGNTKPEKSAEVSTKSLAKAEFTLDDPGAILAEFISNGAAVSGFTFFAYQTETPAGFVGGNPSAAAPTATLTGLFPFVTPGKPWKENRYTVYAGDCAANEPVKASGGEIKEDPTVQVEQGVTTKPVKVEVPAVNAQVYEGTAKVHGAFLTANLQTAMFINTECAAAAPASYQHKVTLGSEGKVEQKYQPYAKKLEFCVVALIGGKYYKYKSPAPFENKAKAGTTIGPFYITEAASSGYSGATVGKLTCP